jgi:hypothetical protein
LLQASFVVVACIVATVVFRGIARPSGTSWWAARTPIRDISRTTAYISVSQTTTAAGTMSLYLATPEDPYGRESPCLEIPDGTSGAFDGALLDIQDRGSQTADGFGYGPHQFGPWATCNPPSIGRVAIPAGDRMKSILEMTAGEWKGRVQTHSFLEGLAMHVSGPVVPGTELTVEAPGGDRFADGSLAIRSNGIVWLAPGDPSVSYNDNRAVFKAPSDPPGARFDLVGKVLVKVDLCEGFTACDVRIDAAGEGRF